MPHRLGTNPEKLPRVVVEPPDGGCRRANTGASLTQVCHVVRKTGAWPASADRSTSTLEAAPPGLLARPPASDRAEKIDQGGRRLTTGLRQRAMGHRGASQALWLPGQTGSSIARQHHASRAMGDHWHLRSAIAAGRSAVSYEWSRPAIRPPTRGGARASRRDPGASTPSGKQEEGTSKRLPDGRPNGGQMGSATDRPCDVRS